jgi:hypothetical protein
MFPQNYFVRPLRFRIKFAAITNGQVDKSNGQKEFERKSLSEELPRQKGRRKEDIDLVLKYQVGGKPVIIPTGTEDYGEALLLLRRKMAPSCPAKPLG